MLRDDELTTTVAYPDDETLEDIFFPPEEEENIGLGSGFEDEWRIYLEGDQPRVDQDEAPESMVVDDGDEPAFYDDARYREPCSFDQTVLMQNIRNFCAYFDVEKLPQGGHCHGLTLYWLFNKRNKNSAWFYDSIAKLCTMSDSNIEPHEEFIKTFSVFILRMQRPDLFWNITQENINAIVGAHKQTNLPLVHFDDVALDTLLQRIALEGHYLCFKSQPAIPKFAHSVGLTFENEDGKFHAYNCNHSSGREELFDSRAEVIAWLKKSFYQDFNLDTPATLPIVFTCIKAKNWPTMETPPVEIDPTRHLSCATFPLSFFSSNEESAQAKISGELRLSF